MDLRSSKGLVMDNKMLQYHQEAEKKYREGIFF